MSKNSLTITIQICKGKEIDFGSELKRQKCLLPNKILTWNEQVPIFSYRSRMNGHKYNFGGEYSCIWGVRLDKKPLSPGR